MDNVKNLLEKLNEEQIKPVLDTEGAVLVIAGAGSGKTRVLTSRIAYLVMEKGVSPYNIMAITFTNKAANEMKERLNLIIGDTGGMWVSTIHSMCVKILRADIDALGYDSNFTIYDETDKDKVLKRIFEEKGLEVDKLLKVVKAHISNAKNECLYPEEYKRKNGAIKFIDEICSVYSEYENVLARSNSLDFDDLLFKTYELFTKRPDIASYYADKFKYIHVDEFQDTNTVQFAIIQRLSLTHGNIFVVGDDDQSIYSWRGAKVENILNFDDIYRGAKIYKLQRNYRSTKKILDLANCIIKNNVARREKELWTENPDGVRIESFIGDDENHEASFVATQIKSIIARTGAEYADFAVFMRLNALSRAFEQEFIKYGIPYKVFGGFRFFERKEVKDVLSYLKLVNNPLDDEAFLRAIATPKRGIGEKSLQELKEFAKSIGCSLFEATKELDNTTLKPATKTKLNNLMLMIESFKAFSSYNTVDKLIDFVLDTTSFKEQFKEKTDENADRLMNIGELKNTAEIFVKDNPGLSLSDYLNSITLSSDTDDMDSDNAVTIATIHSAKGLEYNTVFVSGVDDGVLPIERNSIDDDIEEERRLFYVAVTRAKYRLYLTRARSRYMYGARKHMMQSRFLKECKEVLYPSDKDNREGYYQDRGGFENRYSKGGYSQSTFASRNYGSYNPDVFEGEFSSSSNGGGYSSSYAKTFLGANKLTANENKSSSYKAGAKVIHPKFGEGVIISVKGGGDNVILDILFKGVGMKSLSAKFAPIKIV